MCREPLGGLLFFSHSFCNLLPGAWELPPFREWWVPQGQLAE